MFDQNRGPHASVGVKTENNVIVLDHPSYSPDLNLIETIWGWMSMEVNKNAQ